MKKVSLLLAGGILALASCKEEGATGGMTQMQVDSAINARVNHALDSMATATEGRINELAMYIADSIVKAKQGITVTTPRPAPITRGTGTPPPAPAPGNTGTGKTGGFGDHSDQSQAGDKNTIQGGGFKSKSDQSQQNNPNSVQKGGFKSRSDQSREQQQQR